MLVSRTPQELSSHLATYLKLSVAVPECTTMDITQAVVETFNYILIWLDGDDLQQFITKPLHVA